MLCFTFIQTQFYLLYKLMCIHVCIYMFYNLDRCIDRFMNRLKCYRHLVREHLFLNTPNSSDQFGQNDLFRFLAAPHIISLELTVI